MSNYLNGLIVWFVVTIFVVYAFCLNTAAAVFADPIQQTLHASDFAVSIAIGAFVIGFAIMQIPAGYLLDRYNTKYVISSGVLLLALGNIIISFANSLILFSIANFIQGIGASFAFIAAGIVISQWFSQKWFPILFGISQTLACIFAAIIHYIFVIALLTHTWNEVYQALALFGVTLFIITAIVVKSPICYLQEHTLSLGQSLNQVLSNSQIVLCSIALTLSFGTLLAYAGFWYLTVEKFYLVKTLDAVVISGMMFVGIGFGTTVFGWLSNHVQSRKALIHVALCLGNMFLLMCLYLPHYQVGSLMLSKVVSLVTGFLLSIAMLYYTIVSEISSAETRGVALSFANTGVFIFNSLLMFIPYLFVTNASVKYFTYLWILPFCVLIAILLNYFIKDIRTNSSV